MSVKEFFAFANIKQSVVEFLKNKGDFDQLPAKYKKPFRALINKHHTNTMLTGQSNQNHPSGAPANGNTASAQQYAQVHSRQKGGSNAANNQNQGAGQPNQSTSSQQKGGDDQSNLNNVQNNSANLDLFVSDGFNSIKCQFSQLCQESFAKVYPASLKIYNTVNMLICVQKYMLELRTPSADEVGKEIQVVLIIDDMKVISFDQSAIKLPSSVQFDDQVRTHLSYMRHHLLKKQNLMAAYDVALGLSLTNCERKVKNRLQLQTPQQILRQFAVAGNIPPLFPPTENF